MPPLSAHIAEKEWLQQSAEGNEAAFTELFHSYKHKLYSFLVRLTNSPEMAEDVIQEIFLKLWKDRDQLTNIEQFGGYLFRMAQNQVINAFKRMAKETLILAELHRKKPVSHPDAEENLELQEVQQKLQKALNKLPPQQKRVYMLSREQGLRHLEIARELNISPSTVNNHMILALRTIREQLGQHLYTTAGAWCVLAIIAAFEK